jgi:hypothetical protein
VGARVAWAPAIRETAREWKAWHERMRKRHAESASPERGLVAVLTASLLFADNAISDAWFYEIPGSRRCDARRCW